MQELIDIHTEVFGVEPVFIGLYPNSAFDRLLETVEQGDQPYDERRDLTAEQLKELQDGDLLT